MLKCIHLVAYIESILMQRLTVRNLPPALARALEEEKKRCGRPLNQTVIPLLQQGLGSALAATAAMA